MTKKTIILGLFLFLEIYFVSGISLFSFANTEESVIKYYQKAEILEYQRIVNNEGRALFIWQVRVRTLLRDYIFTCYIPTEVTSFRYKILNSGYYQIYIRFFVQKHSLECTYQKIYWIYSIRKIEILKEEKKIKEENKKGNNWNQLSLL